MSTFASLQSIRNSLPTAASADPKAAEAARHLAGLKAQMGSALKRAQVADAAWAAAAEEEARLASKAEGKRRGRLVRLHREAKEAAEKARDVRLRALDRLRWLQKEIAYASV